jgi:hypothetical protein
MPVAGLYGTPALVGSGPVRSVTPALGLLRTTPPSVSGQGRRCPEGAGLTLSLGLVGDAPGPRGGFGARGGWVGRFLGPAASGLA